MLIGQYDARLDSKSRTALPSKFRTSLGDSLILTKGFESSLIIVSEREYTRLLEGTEGKPFTVKAARELQRFLLGQASSIKLDSKGRFIIPEYLKAHASLTDEIVFLGIQRYVEVWDKTTWETYQTSLKGRIETVADKLTDNEEH